MNDSPTYANSTCPACGEVMYRWNPPCTMDNLQEEILKFRKRFSIKNPIIGLDFAPSVDLRPRWGFSRPQHSGILRILEKDKKPYLRILSEIRKNLPHFKKIPKEAAGHSALSWKNPQQTPLDCAVIYSMVSHYRPGRYIEVGSGISTLFAYRAKTDLNIPMTVESIDPQPRAECDAICDVVHRIPIEKMPLEYFEELSPGDFLVIDGTHRSFMNSDVTILVLDILPKLKPGVIVGFHDIKWPNDYSKVFVNWYWNEQYLLGAYLLGTGGKGHKIIFPLNYCSISGMLSQYMSEIYEWWGHTSLEGWRGGGWFWFSKTGTFRYWFNQPLKRIMLCLKEAATEKRRPSSHFTNSMKRLSIITPSLNQAAYIREAIESVISQNDPACEHIVVDGGSQDGRK